MFFEDPVRRKMKSIEIESVTEAFFQETVSSFLDGILSDKAEHFKVCAPVAAADPKNATSRPPVCPIAVYSSGASALSKLSGLESAVVFKDPDQKNVFAKFPDAQGGWTDAVFPSGLSWLYLSPVPQRGGEKNDPSLTVTAPSPFSLVYWSILLPIFRCFKEGPLGSYASQYFTARLLLYCINPPTGSSTSAKVNTPNPTLLAIASQMMDVWRCFPDVNVHDRAPLSEVLIHLNATLPKLPLLDRSATEDDPSADSKTAYGVGAQAAFAVLCSAVRLEEAWSGVSFPNRVRKSFHKVFSLWRHSVSSAPWQDTPDEEITPEQFFHW
ncbi:hypothetical protein AGDE_14311 [Angomonas deanei]|uniref:Uncharacterized protein n=1 Tax=Angomonas deanei TaxID=59799 RepID=A0A7G2CKP4_9TRYP|nr:hypothetical protein AGDE_14311 [Angomonas deanei]CAD2219657.1 hypothetical protein, conserved [Angomonas deanei]|eukprot:EPY21069.1 hypothetical protein AGDE_14311 [Angomonas deanei]